MNTTASATKANVALVGEYNERVFVARRPELAADYFTPDVKWHGGSLGTVEGPENVTNMLKGFIGALPDLHAVEQEVVAAAGDFVVARAVLEATHQGPLFGIPATGRHVHWDAIDVFRIKDGKIAEEWAADDTTAILHSIGVYSAPWLT